jgi:hypothetical protein
MTAARPIFQLSDFDVAELLRGIHVDKMRNVTLTFGYSSIYSIVSIMNLQTLPT